LTNHITLGEEARGLAKSSKKNFLLVRGELEGACPAT